MTVTKRIWPRMTMIFHKLSDEYPGSNMPCLVVRDDVSFTGIFKKDNNSDGGAWENEHDHVIHFAEVKTDYWAYIPDGFDSDLIARCPYVQQKQAKISDNGKLCTGMAESRTCRDCELYDLPPAQPSVSKTEIVGDVISRQAAIEALQGRK